MGIVTAFLAMTKCQRVHCNDEAGYAFPAMMLQAAYVYRHCVSRNDEAGHEFLAMMLQAAYGYRHCERSAAIPIS